MTVHQYPATATGPDEIGTEIVYVCDPSRRSQLSISLHSLMHSSTAFDRVTIYCVSGQPAGWVFADPRIHVIDVPQRSETKYFEEGRFFVNKTYICRRPAQRLVYLDTDTIIRRPLQHIWKGRSADILARATSRSQQPSWNIDRWLQTLQRFGAKEHFPYLNAGFIIFQNAVQQRVESKWLSTMLQLCEERQLLSELHGPGTRMAEQLAFSLTSAALGFSCQLMHEREHAFGWERESAEAVTVYHTGNAGFDQFVASIGMTAEIAERGLEVDDLNG